MNKSFLKKSGSILMAFVLSCSVFMFPVSAKTEADFEKEIAEMEQQLQQQDSLSGNNQQNIDAKYEKIALRQKQLNLINDRIADLNKNIEAKKAVIRGYQKEMDDLSKEIDKAQQEQTKLEQKIASTYDLLGERMRSVYMAGETSTIEILLASKGFQDFLTRLELLQRVSKHDTDMVSGLQKSIKEFETLKDKLNHDKAAIEEKKKSIEAETASVNASLTQEQKLRGDEQAKISHIKGDLNSLLDYQETLDKNTNNIQHNLDKLREEYDEFKASQMEGGSGSIDIGGNSQFTQSSRGMIFPLQYASAYINNPYGRNGHKGTDMITRGATGNTYGKQIRAAADGVVSTAEYHSSWGNNVYINHGNGVYTRYAHCSKMLVHPGQHVKQGEVIALIGNSGNVFPRPSSANPHAGAHLHFEVWVRRHGSKAVRENPENWIPSHPD